MSLLIDLYKYRCRADRNPQEDFLTEAFKHLLNEFDKAGLSSEVTSELFGIKDKLPSGLRLHWSSQYRIPNGQAAGKRPDLIGKDGQGVFILIENKIGAELGGEMQDDGVWRNQLEIYRDHLDDRSETHKYFVFLTHYTNPPDGFPTKRERVIRWQSIYMYLQQGIRNNDFQHYPALGFLAEKVCNILKEWEMNCMRLELNEIGAMSLYSRLLDACGHFGMLAQHVVDPMLIERIHLDEEHRIGKPSHWGKLDYPNFFGMVLSKTTEDSNTGSRSVVKVSESDVVVWCGALLGECYDSIKPLIPNIPDLSTGIALWTTIKNRKDTFKSEQQAICDYLNGQKDQNNEWRTFCEDNPDKPDEEVVLFVRRRSFTDVLTAVDEHNPSGDWDVNVTDFFQKSFTALKNLPQEYVSRMVDRFE